MLAYPFYYDHFEEWIGLLARQRIKNLVIYGQKDDQPAVGGDEPAPQTARAPR